MSTYKAEEGKLLYHVGRHRVARAGELQGGQDFRQSRELG